MLVVGRVGSSRHVTAAVSRVGCLCTVVCFPLCRVWLQIIELPFIGSPCLRAALRLCCAPEVPFLVPAW